MAESVLQSASSAERHLAVREIPRLPKASAVKALAEKLESKGFGPSASQALARTAVDPADVRRRLERPTPIRVPGAVLWVVEADVWTPTVVPYVANYREAADRIFPADSVLSRAAPLENSPIRRPTGEASGHPILDLQVNDGAHLVRAVERSMSYLVEHNSLADSIEEKGVMFPITLVCTSVIGADGKELVELPATADGSSRVAGALDVLGVDAASLVGRYRSETRDLSALIGRIRSISKRSAGEVSEVELGSVNALIVPARIVVGFEPDATGTADFAKAVHNYVQLTHGDLPPTPWSVTAKVDAKADSVVAELERSNLITPNMALYLEGMLDPKESRNLGFPHQPDERGLAITNLLSKTGSVHTAIKAGVLQASDRKPLRKKAKAEICAELALRAVRSIMSPKDAAVARAVLADLYGNAVIWDADLEPSGRSPEDLLSEALKERRTGEPGSATVELGALGGFWLVVHRVLREARFFKEEDFSDSRSPSAVLTALMDSEWGLTVLARGLTDGRIGRSPARVDPAGDPSRSAANSVTKAHHAWLRGIVVPPVHLDRDGADDAGEQDATRSREHILNDRRKKLEEAVTLVEQRHAELRELQTVEGKILVSERGLPSAKAEELRERLEVVTRALVVYGVRWSETSEPAEEAVT